MAEVSDIDLSLAHLSSIYRGIFTGAREGSLERPFFERAHRGELAFPRCVNCAHFTWYPALRCPRCGQAEHQWTVVAPLVRLFSWTVLERALDPALSELVGETVALAEPVEAANVRLVGNVVGIASDELRLGMSLAVGFVPVADQLSIPVFAPLRGGVDNGQQVDGRDG
jgi:uncharacterized OB-fold protein